MQYKESYKSNISDVIVIKNHISENQITPSHQEEKPQTLITFKQCKFPNNAIASENADNHLIMLSYCVSKRIILPRFYILNKNRHSAQIQGIRMKKNQFNAGKKDERLLTTNEVCEMLRCSRTTLHRWRLDGTIPYIQIKTNIRFKQSDIERVIKGGRK